jgi:hypothetical protein
MTMLAIAACSNDWRFFKMIWEEIRIKLTNRIKTRTADFFSVLSSLFP